MEKVMNFIKTRWLGFWFLVPVAVLTIIDAFVFLSGFGSTSFFSGWSFALALLTAAGFAAAFFKPTEKYAAIIMYALTFATLLTFIKGSYMYLTTAFFGGISGNIFVQAGFTYSFCTLVPIINMLLCIAAMFLKVSRKPKEDRIEGGNDDKPDGEELQEVHA